MKRFARFLHIVVVQWLSECSWRLSLGISGGTIGKLEVALDPHKPSLLHENDIKQQPMI